MHFRVRKNVIQLIRTNYDAGKKRAVSSTIGSVKLATPVLTDTLRQQLTADEIIEFESWIESHHRVNALREELAALSLPETLSLAEKWFAQENDSAAARRVATEVLFHWQSLRKLFSRNGLLD